MTENDHDTNAEAETALMVLGSALEWEDCRGQGFHFDYLGDVSDHETKSYTIEISNGRHYVRPWASTDTADYPTLNEAKAACERHHATGKWE